MDVGPIILNHTVTLLSPQSSCWEPGASIRGYLPAAFLPLTMPWPVGTSSVHGVTRTQFRALASLFPCLSAPPAPLLPSVLPHASERVSGAPQRGAGQPPAAAVTGPLSCPHPERPRPQSREGERQPQNAQVLVLYALKC